MSFPYKRKTLKHIFFKFRYSSKWTKSSHIFLSRVTLLPSLAYGTVFTKGRICKALTSHCILEEMAILTIYIQYMSQVQALLYYTAVFHRDPCGSNDTWIYLFKNGILIAEFDCQLIKNSNLSDRRIFFKILYRILPCQTAYNRGHLVRPVARQAEVWAAKSKMLTPTKEYTSHYGVQCLFEIYFSVWLIFLICLGFLTASLQLNGTEHRRLE